MAESTWRTSALLSASVPTFSSPNTRANHPVAYRVEPGPGANFYGKYGVGTRFTGRNMMGQQEVLTIKEMTYPTRITFNAGPVDVEHTFEEVGQGAANMSLSMKGPKMGRYQNHIGMQLETMRAFIELNIEQILAANPLDTSAPAAEGDYVETDQHKMAMAAAQNMYQQSLAQSVARAARR
ncbi:unnamed protein product [Prorocentrum cordatum]|uniref:Uncharacterized protein n=1 Tax=Prorocentrum cordatum TaxID=2364126 RepID=A0ABN9SRH9_9DINO|nr:unnamed protein product [Polarella glacialis]